MTSNKFNYPDKEGFFGEFGGKFVPETLMYALKELENTYSKLKDDKEKRKFQYSHLLSVIINFIQIIGLIYLVF